MDETTQQQPNPLAIAEQAAALWRAEEWEAGAEALFYVAQVAVAQEEFDHAGQMYVQIGEALLRVPTRQTESRNAFYQARLCYQQTENRPGVATALQGLARHELDAGRAMNAVQLLNTAADLVADDVPQVVEIRTRMASYQAQGGDAKGAARTIELTLPIAPNPQTRQQLTQLHQWYQLADQQALPAAQFEQLLQQTEQRGLSRQLFDRRLLQAYELLAGGDLSGTVRQAVAVRKQAVAANDPMRGMRYFQASVLLALAKDARGDRVGVLTALLTCRAFLADIYGEPQAQNVDALLDGFAGRWGAERMTEAVAVYETKMGKGHKFNV